MDPLGQLGLCFLPRVGLESHQSWVTVFILHDLGSRFTMTLRWSLGLGDERPKKAH